MTKDNIINIFLQVDTDSLDIPLELKENDDGAPKHNLRDLFMHRTLLKRTIISFFQWFVVVGTFYGLAFGAVKASLVTILSDLSTKCKKSVISSACALHFKVPPGFRKSSFQVAGDPYRNYVITTLMIFPKLPLTLYLFDRYSQWSGH